MAARELFAERGRERTTVRAVASRAGVDAALVHRYFGSKAELFAAASAIDLALPVGEDLPAGDIGTVLAGVFLDRWEGASGAALRVLLTAAPSDPVAAGQLLAVLRHQVEPALAQHGHDGAEVAVRAGLVAGQLLGLALGRYVLGVPALVGLDRDELVAWVAPVLQAYAAGPAPRPG